MGLKKKIAYARKVLPAAAWPAMKPAVHRPVHIIFALADHFEPSIVPEDGPARAPRPEQVSRLEWWVREYPKVVDKWRDHDGRPLAHTYFFPAEQYDEGLVEMLADHCHAGWGEIEIHLHHGVFHPDTAEHTRDVITDFRDRLASRHRCLSIEEGSTNPRYAFVHGDFALGNSALGRWCGVDNEVQILADTGCYADLTMPGAPWDPAQVQKINSVYECAIPLDQQAPHRKGYDLATGRQPRLFPLMIQGPLLVDVGRAVRSLRPVFDNGTFTGTMPPTMRRFSLWKQTQISVAGRPDWLFIKVHCHSMNPGYKDAVIGQSFQKFLQELVEKAPERKETIHFVVAREMTNILLAACDGREGDPGDYRDYRFKRMADVPMPAEHSGKATLQSMK